MATDKSFNADYYATEVAFQMASRSWLCAMLDSGQRSKLAGAYARACKKCIEQHPNMKPDYRTVKGMVAEDTELKGFISILIFNVILGLITKVIVDWIWRNWTATPNGEPD